VNVPVFSGMEFVLGQCGAERETKRSEKKAETTTTLC
jgi:hypothetical protein